MTDEVLAHHEPKATPQLPSAPAPVHRPPLVRWLRRLALLAAVVAALLLLCWLALPPLLKWQGEKQLAALLGRPVQIARVEVQPWALRLALEGVRIGAASSGAGDAAPPQFELKRVLADLDWRSLPKLAPVVEALRIDEPLLRIARTAPGHYDFDDVLARLAPDPAKPAGEPARFALYNVELHGGRVLVDDRPVARSHTLDALELALPFLSNLPSDIKIKVQPHLSFALNGSRFDSSAEATPFAADRASQLALRINGFDVAPWLPYLPGGLPLRLERGVLAADLALRFAVDAGGAPRVSLHGKASASEVAARDPGAQPLLGWRKLEVELDEVQPLARKLALGAVRLDGAALVVRRGADGRLTLLVPASAAAAPTKVATAAPVAGNASPAAPVPAGASPSKAASAPSGAEAGNWTVSLKSLELADAQIDWQDAAVAPAAALRLGQLQLRAGPAAWPGEASVPVQLDAVLRPADAAATADGEGATLTLRGDAGPQRAALAFEAQRLDLAWVAPYLAQHLAARLDGRAELDGQLDWAGGAAPKLQLALKQASIEHIALHEGGGSAVSSARRAAEAKPAPRRTAKAASLRRAGAATSTASDVASLKALRVADATIDLQARQAVLGRVELDAPKLTLARGRDGAFSFEQWLRTGPPQGAPSSSNAPQGAPSLSGAPPAAPSSSSAPKAALSSTSAAPAAPPWTLRLRQLKLDGGQLRWRDDKPAAGRVDVQASQLSAVLDDFAWPARTPARLQLAVRVGSAGDATVDKERAAARSAQPGRIDWRGDLQPDPLLLRGQLQLERVPAHLFEPYFDTDLRLALTHALVSWRGAVDARQGKGGVAVTARGDAALADVQVHARSAQGRLGDELLNWHTFSLRGVKADVPADAAGGARPKFEVAEAVLADFYSKLVITEQGRFNLQDATRALDAPDAAASAPAAPASAPAAPASAPAPNDKPLPFELSVAATRIVNGKVDFSDHFIRPNYSAALSELNGSIGAYRSDSREMAQISLRGKAQGTAQLEISGALNPTARPLALDIKAKATDLELAPLSPYSGRYAGYAIERGKLSVDVAYKIDPDGKLDARNQIVLNQLTFGDKVDSPDATKLPVRLAVALLTDRDGVIDLDLPISGSINDPQFSVFGLVLKVIGNLIVKAITAPFSLFAGGGGGPDLSFIGFEPGTATPNASGQQAIAKIVTAMQNRPALTLTVTGESDAQAERGAMQAAALQRRLQVEQRRELVARGADAEAALPPLSAEARAALVKRLYADTKLDGKPRNLIGLAKDVPPAEMEQRLRAALPAGADVARELALQRGVVVRDALVAQGLPAARVFLAAPKLHDEVAASAASGPSAPLAAVASVAAEPGSAAASAAAAQPAAWTPRAALSLKPN